MSQEEPEVYDTTPPPADTDVAVTQADAAPLPEIDPTIAAAATKPSQSIVTEWHADIPLMDKNLVTGKMVPLNKDFVRTLCKVNVVDIKSIAKAGQLLIKSWTLDLDPSNAAHWEQLDVYYYWKLYLEIEHYVEREYQTALDTLDIAFADDYPGSKYPNLITHVIMMKDTDWTTVAPVATHTIEFWNWQEEKGYDHKDEQLYTTLTSREVFAVFMKVQEFWVDRLFNNPQRRGSVSN